jgi:chromosome segregation ATPase
MRSMGDIDDRRCPQCKQFLANADIIVQKMETIERRLKDLQESLSKYEWTIIENSMGIKDMRKNGMELDAESFDVAFNQTKQFLRLLETIESNLNSIMRNYNDINNSDGSVGSIGTV